MKVKFSITLITTILIGLMPLILTQQSLASMPRTPDNLVRDWHQIADNTNGFGTLSDGDTLGRASSEIGDINGDGVIDIAVGAQTDDTGGNARGAIYILLMNSDGTVNSYQKIANNTGGFGSLDDQDFFGTSISNLGDLNNDDVPDLIVGAHGDDTGGSNQGSFYVLFMNADGTVNTSTKVAENVGGFNGTLNGGDQFGKSLALLGDLNNDDVIEIAVSANSDNTGGDNRGAVYILSLTSSGTVIHSQKIAHNTGGFGNLSNNDFFGFQIGAIDDVNGDGVPDLGVGAVGDDTGGNERGAAYLLFLNSNSTVNSYQKIANNTGGMGLLDDNGRFGSDIDSIGDFNRDGLLDVIVGAGEDNTGGPGRGAAYLLYLNQNGTVNSYQKIADNTNGFGTLSDQDGFGISTHTVSDFNNDCVPNILAGAAGDDTGGNNRGSVYILTVTPPVTATADLQLSHTLTPLTSTVGDSLTYTLQLSNNGRLTATHILISDTFPSNLLFPTIILPTPITMTTQNDTTLWHLTTLAPQQAHTITVTGQLSDTTPRSITTTATINNRCYDGELSNNTTSTQFTVIPSTDLQLHKNVQPTTLLPLDTITYTLTFTNVGNAPWHNIFITDTMPTTINNVQVILPTNVTATAVTTQTPYIWLIDQLLPNQSATIHLSGQVDLNANDSTITNVATISTSPFDPNTLNNQAAVAVTVQPAITDLQLTKSVQTPATPFPLDTITYTITFTNSGNIPWHNILITDTMPTTIGNVQIILPTNITATAVSTQTPYIWLIDQLLPNQSATIHLIGQLNEDTANTTITNTAAIATTPFDSIDNNSATATITVGTPSSDCQHNSTHAYCIHMPLVLHNCMWPVCLPTKTTAKDWLYDTYLFANPK